MLVCVSLVTAESQVHGMSASGPVLRKSIQWQPCLGRAGHEHKVLQRELEVQIIGATSWSPTDPVQDFQSSSFCKLELILANKKARSVNPQNINRSGAQRVGERLH